MVRLPSIVERLFRLLSEILWGSNLGPLLCIGDFNQVLHHSEKLGSPTNHQIPGVACFQEFLYNLSLSEIPNEGPYFTWTNNRAGNSCIFEWLDKSFCNGDWASLNLSTIVTNLPIHGSDHPPILLYTSRDGSRRKRLFRFERFWTFNDECKTIICSSWQETF